MDFEALQVCWHIQLTMWVIFLQIAKSVWSHESRSCQLLEPRVFVTVTLLPGYQFMPFLGRWTWWTWWTWWTCDVTHVTHWQLQNSTVLTTRRKKERYERWSHDEGMPGMHPMHTQQKTPNLLPSRASGLGMSFLFRMSCIRDAPTPDQTQQSHCSWEPSLGKPERNSKNGFDRPLNSQSSASPAADGSWPPCHSKLSPWSIGQWAAAAFQSNSQPWISCQGTPHHLGLEE